MKSIIRTRAKFLIAAIGHQMQQSVLSAFSHGPMSIAMNGVAAKHDKHLSSLRGQAHRDMVRKQHALKAKCRR